MTTDLPLIADYLIVGGGTAGLVVTCRLYENPDVNVVVLESGPDRTNSPRVQDPGAWHSLSGSELDWKLKIAAQNGLNNREQDHPAGKVLGGSSAINGLAYVPPSPAGIDAWAKLGNPKWNWESLRPYLQKSYTVTPPENELHLNEGQRSPASGPIQVTYPALADKVAHPLLQAWNDAFPAQGKFNTDILAEQKTIGARPYTATIDPVSGLRSSADTQYGAVASAHPNVTIVTEATVRRILFESHGENAIATGAEVAYKGQVATVKATKEVILAAGAFHTPKLLELSGVGDKTRLSNLGIPLVIDQPGVGDNLQNHLMSVLPVPLQPTAGLKGITPGLKALAFVRLGHDELKRLLAFGPQSKTASETVIRTLLLSPNEASASLFLALRSEKLALLGAITCFPLSRGTTHISSADPDAMPTIDAGFLTNEVDLEILARHARSLHELTNAESLQPFFQSSNAPANLEEIKNTLRATALTAHHTCGTAAMLPREDGGVVDQNLKVYGTDNLRIVDASVFPLIPHANPMATVYAVAERAADLIRGV